MNVLPVAFPLLAPFKVPTARLTRFGREAILCLCNSHHGALRPGYRELIDWNFLMESGTKIANITAIPINTVAIGF